MNKPTDYPVQADNGEAGANSAPAEITYAVLKDRVDAKQRVTDEMIRIARSKLDAAHTHNATNNRANDQGKFNLDGIRDRLKLRRERKSNEPTNTPPPNQ